VSNPYTIAESHSKIVAVKTNGEIVFQPDILPGRNKAGGNSGITRREP
jgi:hypothetical protein